MSVSCCSLVTGVACCIPISSASGRAVTAFLGWIRQNTRALPLLRKHVQPQHLLQVKYEQLVSDPVRELTRMCQFVELEFEPAMLDFAAAVHHSTHGNNVRLRRSSAIRAGDEWTQHLSDDDLEYFEHRAGWLNRELGYT